MVIIEEICWCLTDYDIDICVSMSVRYASRVPLASPWLLVFGTSKHIVTTALGALHVCLSAPGGTIDIGAKCNNNKKKLVFHYNLQIGLCTDADGLASCPRPLLLTIALSLDVASLSARRALCKTLWVMLWVAVVPSLVTDTHVFFYPWQLASPCFIRSCFLGLASHLTPLPLDLFLPSFSPSFFPLPHSRSSLSPCLGPIAPTADRSTASFLVLLLLTLFCQY